MGSRIKADQIYITEQMKPDESEDNTLGLYERKENRIIILRTQLKSKEDYLGTLIHELTHADTVLASGKKGHFASG